VDMIPDNHAAGLYPSTGSLRLAGGRAAGPPKAHPSPFPGPDRAPNYRYNGLVLRIGYVFLISALALLTGYAVYWAVRLLFGIAGIPLFLKVVIALALFGLLLVILGLLRERLREGREV